MFKNRMKSWMSSIVFLFVLLLCVDGVCAQKTEQAIGLTPEERAWLAAHPIIRFSGDPAYLPLEAFSTDGKYIGIFADILDLLESRLDVRFERVPVSTWSEAVRMAEAGEVDFLSESTQSGRDKLFTNPHTQISVVIIGRKGTPALSSPAELNGRKVAVVKGYEVHTPFREANPEINFVEVGSTRDGLLMVTTGGVDAFISTPLTASYLMSELGLENLSIIGYTGAIIKLGFGVRRNAPQLVSILNRALSTITELEKLAFRVKWSANKFEPPQVQLTPEEGAWLKAHPDIRLVFPKGHEPSMMKDDEGRFTGVMADYWNLLSNRLGIDVKFELVPMSELPKLIKNKEVEGMLFASPKLIEAFDLVGAGPVIQSYAVIYGRQTKAPFQFPQDLFDKKVAILKGYDHTDHAVSPIRGKADLIEVVSPLEGLKATHRKKVDFFIGSIGNNYTVNKYLLFGIGPIHVFWGNPYTLVPAVRPDLPELASILNKGTDLVSKEEFNAIVGKWTQVRQLKYTIDLTPEERVWLDEHPVITLGGGIFPPLDDFNDVKDRPEGIGPDYTELIGDLLGIKFKYISDDWDKILMMAEEKKIDGIRIMLRNKEREAYLNFTQPHISIQYAIFVQKQSGQLRTLKELSHKQVGLMKDTYSHSYLREHYPDIIIVPFKSIDDALFALIGGELDAVVASLTVAGVAADRLFITSLKVAATVPEMDTRLQIGVRKDWPQLVTILNKAIDAITPEQHREIKRRWITFEQEGEVRTLSLSPEERAWLSKNHTVRVRVVHFPPFGDFDSEGRVWGISVDYLKLVAERTGVVFDFIPETAPFYVALESMKNRDGPDLIQNMAHTHERESSISFSEAYFSAPRVIYIRTGTDWAHIQGIEDLIGKTIATVRATVVTKHLERRYPDIDRQLHDSDKECLDAVASGKADAYIGNLTLGTYLIQENGLTNLKIAAPSPFEDHFLSFGSRKDWPELSSIINKGLYSISLAERSAIRNSYFAIRYEHGIKSADVLKWILIIVGGASGILILFIFWNRSLAKRVSDQTCALETSNKSLEAEIIERKQVAEELLHLKDQLQEENIYLREEIQLDHNFEEIIGNSEGLRYVLFRVEQIAPTDTTVLILGETGTGKELIARAIHSTSPRKERPLIKVNCATLQAHLIESELFGHEKGAFTGATAKRIGRFELADGATLFLDEIGEMPLELQPKLLRVLQDGEFERLGSSRTIEVDVRLIAATNRDLEAEIQAGRFRQDLFYRLNVYSLTLPPLHERREDIPLLVDAFIKKYNKKMGKRVELISQKTTDALIAYSWPGNIRELQNIIEKAVIVAQDKTLHVELPKIQTLMPDHGPTKTLDEMERDYIQEVLNLKNWRIDGPEGAAAVLDLKPSTLRFRMKKLGIKRPS